MHSIWKNIRTHTEYLCSPLRGRDRRKPWYCRTCRICHLCSGTADSRNRRTKKAPTSGRLFDHRHCQPVRTEQPYNTADNTSFYCLKQCFLYRNRHFKCLCSAGTGPTQKSCSVVLLKQTGYQENISLRITYPFCLLRHDIMSPHQYIPDRLLPVLRLQSC